MKRVLKRLAVVICVALAWPATVHAQTQDTWIYTHNDGRWWSAYGKTLPLITLGIQKGARFYLDGAGWLGALPRPVRFFLAP